MIRIRYVAEKSGAQQAGAFDVPSQTDIERLVELEVATAETHTSSAEVSQHPVERGADISDHVRPGQDRLTIEAFVSNTPIRTPATNAGGATGEVRQLDLGQVTRLDIAQGARFPQTAESGERSEQLQASVLQFDQPFDRVRDVYEEIRSIIATKRVVKLETSLRDYEDMILTNLSVPRTVEDGDGISFTFDATHISVVQSGTVAVTERNQSNKPQRRQDGHKPKTEVKRESVMHKGKEGIKSAWGL
jgi:hypothetical protein